MNIFEKYGIRHIPQFIQDRYDESKESAKLDREFLSGLFERTNAPEKLVEKIFKTIDLIEEKEDLAKVTNFIIRESSLQRNRLDGEHIAIRGLDILGEEYSPFYPIVILYSVIKLGIEACEKRGIGPEWYEPRYMHPLMGSYRGFERRGTVRVGFPWELNSYSCSMFHFDRFYLILHPYSAEFSIFRNKNTNEVIALSDGNIKIRKDGQFDGLEGIFDDDPFTTVYEEDEKTVKGNRISPVGVITKEVVTLDKSEWERACKHGDAFLALHIPGGPGYRPEMLKLACEHGLEFYKKYFPEYDVKGIWSESWLYDPHLRLLLDEDKGIIQMQNQMYCAPFREGRESIHGELHYHDEPEKKTSLELKVEAYEKAGGKFATCYMFILADDVKNIKSGEDLYPDKEMKKRYIETRSQVNG